MSDRRRAEVVRNVQAGAPMGPALLKAIHLAPVF